MTERWRTTVTVTVTVACVLLAGASTARAQSAAMDGLRGEFTAVRTAVMTAATKAPENLYGFQPTPDVFTLRKQLLHIADASYSICSGAQGTPGQRPKVDDDAELAKPQVIETLTAAFAFCDSALTKTTDAALSEMVTPASGTARPKSYYVAHLLAHTSLHYGNVVTYLRLNKLSPGQ